jgi:predicted GH43/DUF377 family glycosyl hydrolase
VNTTTGNYQNLFAILQRVQPSPAIEGSTGADVIVYPDRIMWYAAVPHQDKEEIVVISTDTRRLQPPLAIDPTSAPVAVGAGPPGSFDEYGAYDPATVQIGTETALFYSGAGRDGDFIGRATSLNGFRFVKDPDPVLPGRAPEIIYRSGIFRLFYVIDSPRGGYEIHLSTSTDGKSFSPSSAHRVLGVGEPGSWDSFSVTTPRVFAHQDAFYMVYAGDDSNIDMPRAFGLARSRDLERWERYARNPVFTVGQSGSWDDCAIWFGTVVTWEKALYLLYEGASQSSDRAGHTSNSVGLAGCSLADFEEAVNYDGSWVS